MTSTARSPSQTLQILALVSFTFVGYLCVGVPLGVLPLYINDTLGMGSLVTGIAISLTPLCTLLTRPWAGSLSDRAGPKRAVTLGLLGCALSGLLTLLATSLDQQPGFSLGLLLVGRVALGLAQGLVGTGCISWALGRVGTDNTAQVISWNGIAANGAMAISAPIGVVMASALGLWSMGSGILAVALLAWLAALGSAPVAVIPGQRLGFASVLLKVSPNGVALALGSIGFGTLATFITLYYHRQGWSGGAYCLSAFSLAFMGARLLFAGAIQRVGGYRVAMVSLTVETLGLTLLWLAQSPQWAMTGALLAGFGLSLVYPALGVEVLPRIPAANRGIALGAYALFFDLALGLAGPLMGQVASHLGFADIFLGAALMSLAGLLLVLFLHRTNERSGIA